MYLLDTTTLQLVSFAVKDRIPPYAILSHTWSDDEINFQDLQKHPNSIKELKGYSKIEQSCALARKYHFKYIWIDTCCINKKSSAELSEAINSMFQYYLNSRVCYAFLSDVDPDEDPRSEFSTFQRSRWFRRGWTLQELIAPGTVIFFGRKGSDWIEIGTKASLQDLVSVITRIPSSVLSQNRSTSKALAGCSVAQKMSWAAKRETTRAEDLAYCLMGLFGVHMPPLYGEGGPRAFMRLQEQIIRYIDDHTVFAWRSNVVSDGTSEVRGLFASSPSEFLDSGNIVPYTKPGEMSTRILSRYTITNLGLHMRVPLLPVSSSSLVTYDPHTQQQRLLIPKEKHQDIFLAVLNCRREGRDRPLALYLRRENEQQFVRVLPDRLMLGRDSKSQMHVIYVKERNSLELASDLHNLKLNSSWKQRYKFEFRLPDTAILDYYPKSLLGYQFDGGAAVILYPGLHGDFGIMKLRDSIRGRTFLVVFGFNFSAPYDNQNVWSDIIINSEFETLNEVYQSYRYEGRRSTIRSQPLDRVVKPLTNDCDVTVFVHTPPDANKRLIEVAYAPTSKKIRRVHSLTPSTYGFAVQIHFHDWTPSTSTPHLLLPKDLWVEDGKGWQKRNVIRFTEVKDTGLIVFRSKDSSLPFVVVLGVNRHRVWTDIITPFGSSPLEDAQAAWSSSLTHWLQQRSLSSTKTMSGMSVSIPQAGCDVRVRFTENQELNDLITHYVDIYIEGHPNPTSSSGRKSCPGIFSSPYPSFAQYSARPLPTFHKSGELGTNSTSITVTQAQSKPTQAIPYPKAHISHKAFNQNILTTAPNLATYLRYLRLCLR
ncbi:hypothetical protein VKT23_005083 [Stygiomarasmius scandens]|uniref:HET-domain-containing protein n=1 Tax=Marasmiellus scandens TaxID=2682957 RepID=A0ABR1JT16_9AGAR